MYFKKGQRFIHISLPAVIGAVLLLVALVSLGTVMLFNPFGALKFRELGKLNQGISLLNRYYYEEVDAQKMVDGALIGAAASLEDPYTAYMTKSEADSFIESVESADYAGVGLYISEDLESGAIKIVKPLKDSPAEKAGLAADDIILAVDGESVENQGVDSVAARMKGPDNTQVVLTVLKKDTGETVDVTLVRAVIKRATVTSGMIDAENAYINISQFGLNTYDEFVENYNNLVGQGMKRLVLDLRNNPGGYMEMAVSIADIFIGEGEIVYTLNREGEKNPYMAGSDVYRVPMVILMNGQSASASEVLVGALTHYGVAKTVGEQTFGKGVTQSTHLFPDGSLMKITDSRYYTPSGVCIHGVGLTPDYVVPMDSELYAKIPDLPFEEDPQVQKAVEVLNPPAAEAEDADK